MADTAFSRIRLNDGANMPVQVESGVFNAFLNCSGAGLVVPGPGARIVLHSNYRIIPEPGSVACLFVPDPCVLTDWGIVLAPQRIVPGSEIRAVGVVVADVRVGTKRGRGGDPIIIPEGTRIGCVMVLRVV